ncbi:MAG TPA: universal stress protein [Candidatus Polarisedimenticolia bacterium]|nr:universal stress protein [Candidatus Polarisedimenticolia bacterium]
MPRTYAKIYVPVDNSGHSFAAIDLAVDMAVKLDASLAGSHVFEAGATDSYLDLMEECCRTASVRFERRTLGGRHHKTLLEDIAGGDYDLVIMGALGAGAVDESQIGSVTERVVRGATVDILVVKDLIPNDGPILVAVDGSSQSLEALCAAITFAGATGRGVEGVVVAEAPLARATSAALESARARAEAEGTDLEFIVTEGKPFDRILKTCREKKPWLLVVGKTGADAEAGDDLAALGSTTGNLLRLAPCNVLVTPGSPVHERRTEPAGAAAAAAVTAPAERRLLTWTPDAERLLEDVPGEQRLEMIRTVEQGARKLGITVITADTIDRVMLGYIDS